MCWLVLPCLIDVRQHFFTVPCFECLFFFFFLEGFLLLAVRFLHPTVVLALLLNVFKNIFNILAGRVLEGIANCYSKLLKIIHSDIHLF